jgi:hypothetical protein
MVTAVHALVGGALGSVTRSRAGAAALGVAAHAACDSIPHRDLSVPIEVALAVAALGTIGLVAGRRSTEFWGAVGGVVPDLENLVPASYRGGHKWFPSHWFAHAVGEHPMWTTLLVAAAAIGWLLWRWRRKSGAGPDQRTGEASSGEGTSSRRASPSTFHQP